MSKNIVICCDGTGNQINDQLSNVLKLYRVLQKTEDQLVYYSPGVGTVGRLRRAASPIAQGLLVDP